MASSLSCWYSLAPAAEPPASRYSTWSALPHVADERRPPRQAARLVRRTAAGRDPAGRVAADEDCQRLSHSELKLQPMQSVSSAIEHRTFSANVDLLISTSHLELQPAAQARGLCCGLRSPPWILRKVRLLQQAVDQDVDVDLLGIGDLVAAAAAAALRVGGVVQAVLRIEHAQSRAE